MKPFADASFLLCFFAFDEHSSKADRGWKKHGCLMRTFRLALFEAENSIRRMRVGKQLTEEEEYHALESMKRGLLEGFIELLEVPVRRLYPSARRLSQHHNKTKGYGAMYILHVASALDLRCDTLLTFDDAQAELARAEGLKTAF